MWDSERARWLLALALALRCGSHLAAQAARADRVESYVAQVAPRRQVVAVQRDAGHWARVHER